jgi:hypothetical protein
MLWVYNIGSTALIQISSVSQELLPVGGTPGMFDTQFYSGEWSRTSWDPNVPGLTNLRTTYPFITSYKLSSIAIQNSNAQTHTDPYGRTTGSGSTFYTNRWPSSTPLTGTFAPWTMYCSGYLNVPFTENYTIRGGADDFFGVRLSASTGVFIVSANGRTAILSPSDWATGTVNLVSGVPYLMEVFYSNTVVDSIFCLELSSARIPLTTNWSPYVNTLTNSLCAFYNFEGNGNDATGNGFNLTEIGSTVPSNFSYVTDPKSNVLSLTGSGFDFGWFQGNYLQAVRDNPITGNSSWSVSCWVKIISNDNSSQGGNPIFSFGDPGIGETPNGGSVGIFITGGTNNLTISHWGVPYDTPTTTNLTTGTWNHIVVTYDGTNERIYLNNSLILTKVHTQPLTIGTGRFNFNKWTNNSKSGLGNIFRVDETGIWGRVLTPFEISTLYNNGNGLSITI